jgi:hypothetical protein
VRRNANLQIITEAIEHLIPGAAPAFLTVTVTETLPGTANPDGSPHKHQWSGQPEGLAERIFTALFGRPDTTPQTSPLQQAEDAKQRRDLADEIDVLMSAGAALESAPWHPARPGDLVHVHYEGAGHMPAFGETYLVTAGAHGFLSMQLLAHTLPDTEDSAGMVGCFAVEDDPDPLTDLWFEAGPHRLTIVRNGRPVHIGGVR